MINEQTGNNPQQQQLGEGFGIVDGYRALAQLCAYAFAFCRVDE
jgi:hypothetical protein